MAPETEEQTPPIESDGSAQQDQGPSEEEQFREEQRRLAASQNLTGENVVPEKRPIASQEKTDYHESDEYVKLRDREDALAQQEPMGKEAYDRADSDSQRKKADKASRNEVMPAASFVKVIDGDYEGRVGAVIEVHYKDEAAERQAALGTPEARFAEVDHYLIRTRDGRNDLLSVKPEEVQAVRQSARVRGTS